MGCQIFQIVNQHWNYHNDSDWKFTWVKNHGGDLSWKGERQTHVETLQTTTYLRFSAMSIWFSRSPLSVVSACSIFQLKFSISASSWACWYSNWKLRVETGSSGEAWCYQMFPRAALHVVCVRICVLQSVPEQHNSLRTVYFPLTTLPALSQQSGGIKEILPVYPGATAPHHLLLHNKMSICPA